MCNMHYSNGSAVVRNEIWRQEMQPKFYISDVILIVTEKAFLLQASFFRCLKLSHRNFSHDIFLPSNENRRLVFNVFERFYLGVKVFF